jgi:hypothetical protein
VLVVVIGGGAFFLVGHHGKTGGSNGHAGGKLTATSCSTSMPSTKTINLDSDNRPTGPSPFAVKALGQYSFVSVKDGIEVWLDRPGKAPRQIRTVGVPGNNKGLAVTGNGQYLLSANGQGVVLITRNRALGQWCWAP